MTLLVLGGTADGRHLATALHKQGVDVIYSVAGLVRKPDVPCKVISGGFSQHGGLAKFLKLQNIVAILDATHPYAKNMSDTAVSASQEVDIACWRFHRKPWLPNVSDHWVAIDHWLELQEHFTDKARVFLSAGQVEQDVLDHLAKQFSFMLFRTAVKPKLTLPANVHWLKAIGPFDKADELALLKEHDIDLIVSKNSGGEATVAKLVAARELGITVAMFNRPELLAAQKQWSDKATCITDICKYLNIEQPVSINHAV